MSQPRDLEQLDQLVRQQFHRFWDRLQTLENARDVDADRLSEAWGAMGQWFHAYSYEDSARRCFLNAHVLDAKEPRWPYYLGQLAEDSGLFDEATAFYSKAAALSPSEVAPLNRLGALALQRQDVALAEDYYSRVLALDPTDPGGLYGKAKTFILKQDMAAALPLLKALVARQPEALEPRYSLAQVWRHLGEKERSAHQLSQIPKDALDQTRLGLNDPWDTEIRRLDIGSRMLTRRGVKASRRGDHILAARLLSRAVQADPEGADERLNYALALEKLGNRTEAVEQLQEALRLAEGKSDTAARANRQLGFLAMQSGRPQLAETYLDAALSLDPQSIPAHLDLARLKHHQQDLSSALEHYAVVRKLDPNLPEVRFWYAAVLLALKREKDALQAIDDDLKAIGRNRDISLLEARILAASSDGALRDPLRARRVLEAQDDKSDAFYAETAAMLAAANEDWDSAVRWQRAAVAALSTVRPRQALHTANRRLALYQEKQPCRNPWEIWERPIRSPVDRIED